MLAMVLIAMNYIKSLFYVKNPNKKNTWKGSYSSGDINMKGLIDDGLLDKEVTILDYSGTRSSYTCGLKG